jgi:hypothetical protein
VDARSIARLHALGRVAIGAGFVLAPERAAPAWAGSVGARPGARVLAAALGARDLGIGLGALHAFQEGRGVRPWLRAGLLADAVDLGATLRHRTRLPATAVAGVVVLAGGSIALGAWLDRTLG